MILRNSHILIMIVTLLMSSKEHPYVDPTYRLINTTTEYLAGDNIVLEISTTTDDNPLLKIIGNQGIILIKPIKNDAYLKYSIPQFISNEAGVFYWKLLQTNLEGKLKILPKNIHHIESYVGPPTLEASKDDFTMITILPVDEFDNPQLDSTTVTLKNFIDFKKEEKDLLINDLFTFDILNAPTSTGKLITTVTSGNVSSKEHTIDIMAGRAVDFTLRESVITHMQMVIKHYNSLPHQLPTVMEIQFLMERLLLFIFKQSTEQLDKPLQQLLTE